MAFSDFPGRALDPPAHHQLDRVDLRRRAAADAGHQGPQAPAPPAWRWRSKSSSPPGRHRTGRTAAWFGVDDLGTLVRRHRADGSITKAFWRITRVNLIVVDDIGMLPVGEDVMSAVPVSKLI